MTWTRLDDLWSEKAVIQDLDVYDRWHYLTMLQHCSRAEKYDGIMRLVDAQRSSDHPEPDRAIRNLVAAGLITVDGKTVSIKSIDDHIPPPHVRKQTDQNRIRKRRERAHEKGDHGMCLPKNCEFAPVESKRDVTRDTARETPKSEPESPESVTPLVTRDIPRDVRTGQDRPGLQESSDEMKTEPEFQKPMEPVFSWPTVKPGEGRVNMSTGEIEDVSLSRGVKQCVRVGCDHPRVEGNLNCADHGTPQSAVESSRWGGAA